MTGKTLSLAVLLLAGLGVAARSQTSTQPTGPIDAGYSAQIKQFTTEPFFTTELVSTLPASSTVPTPEKVLGYIAGAENHLTYSKDIYRYFHALEAASPRVKLFTIGQTEEGRDIIVAAVSSEENIAHLDDYKAMAAQLADPRTLDPNVAHENNGPENIPAKAQAVIAKDVPFYWLTGSIHSSESGSPEMLMELAYRLAVDPSPMYEGIRKNWVVLITPVIEVDGHDRFVDVYNWHRAHLDVPQPPLVYWGHYVAHDNNRDAMGLSLKLNQAAMRTFLDYHPLVMHDLHESEAYLYDNTLGTEPFNPWLDPIVTQEWEQIAWYNVAEMTKRGVPGVYTFGGFTTWDPSYLYFIANSHNSIGRLYETFGNGGADTKERELGPADTSRTWYRPDPPLPKVLWSQRDNTNYQESAILFSLDYLARNREEYVRNFYIKSARAVAKAYNEGPAAYVLPADDPRTGLQTRLIDLLQEQGAEVDRSTQAFTINAAGALAAGTDYADSMGAAGSANSQPRAAERARQFPAGSFIVRMDQPYSRIADMLLDQEYYSPSDRAPYDDSGWSQGPLRNVVTVRVTDAKILDLPMEKITGKWTPEGSIASSGGAAAVYAIANYADPDLATLRFRLAKVPFQAAESAFDADGHHFPAGSFLIPATAGSELQAAAKDLGIEAVGLSADPSVARHDLEVPRIAVVHTWSSTQNEGWYRIVLDRLQVPYTYIDDHDVRDHDDLRQRFDVVLFPPASGSTTRILNGGLPAWSPPIPWKTTPLTPNIGKLASTDDMRGGLDFSGVQHLRDFVQAGGVLITALDTSNLLVEMGLTPGVAEANRGSLRARGVVLNADFLDTHSPIAYGYDAGLGVYFNDGPLYSINYGGGGGGGGRGGASDQRASGRGSLEPGQGDTVQGRVNPPENPHPQARPWEAPYLSPEAATGAGVIPEALRPRVILRFADARQLLYSGQLANGQVMAGRPAVIDVPQGTGHMVLFAINPMWRGETEGSYALVLNAILNFNHLGLGQALPPAGGRGGTN